MRGMRLVRVVPRAIRELDAKTGLVVMIDDRPLRQHGSAGPSFFTDGITARSFRQAAMTSSGENSELSLNVK